MTMTPLSSTVKDFLNIDTLHYDEFCAKLIPSSVKKGEYLLRSGDKCDFMVILVKGSARTFYITTQGEEISYLLQYEVDFLTDYESILLNAPAKNNIQILEDSDIYILPFSAMEELYKSDSYWIEHAKTSTEKIYLKTRSRIEDLLCLNAEQRYLKLLREQPMVFNRIPQKYIASYLGVKPQSLSRIRSNLLT